MAKPIPIGQGPQRLPQAGRIRLGRKTKTRSGKDAPTSVDGFIFTSPVARLLEPVAEVYEGSILPWNEAKSGDRFQLVTKATEIKVQLPPEPLTEAYELWSGQRGLERRCDGYTCTRAVPGPEGYEMQDEPCLCAAAGVLSCKYKLRLSMLLPEVETLGVWRLDTSSEHARKEIPAVVQAIQQLQGAGFTNAVLRLEHRTAPGKRFNVPVLDPAVSLGSLLAGEQRVAALPGSPPELPPTPAPAVGEARAAGLLPQGPAAPSPDDEVIEGEIVEEVDPDFARTWLENMPGPKRNKALRIAKEMAEAAGEPVPVNAEAIPPHILNHIAKELLDE